MGVVYASINVSEASRATVYPGELTFTPDNWADPKVGRPLHTVHCLAPQLPATVQPSMPHLPLREKSYNYPQVFYVFRNNLLRINVQLQTSCT